MYKKVYFIHFEFVHLILEYVIAFHFLGDLDFNILTCCSFNDTGVSFFNPSSSRSNTIKRMLFVRCNAVLGVCWDAQAVSTVRIDSDPSPDYSLIANYGGNIFTHLDWNDKVLYRATSIDFSLIFGCHRTGLDGDFCFTFTSQSLKRETTTPTATRHKNTTCFLAMVVFEV